MRFPVAPLRRLIVVLPLLMLLTAPSLRAQTAATYHARADQALQSFLMKFWNGGQQYLRHNYPDNGSLTGYWTYAHGWNAVLDGVERTGGQRYAGWIETLYQGQADRGWFAGYYDDECWMAITLLHAYDLTRDAKYLNQAGALYADIMGGWDTGCCGTVKGGVWWDKAHTQKATASNAGAALAGALLYQRTTNVAYLNFARQVYGYWFTNMVSPNNFQVTDHINPDGTKVNWKFTYNEGLMLGAALELHTATGDARYLTNAQRFANFMIGSEVTGTAYGNVLSDGANANCTGDCAEFKAPAYRYLMQLYARDPSKTQYYNVLKASADAIWNLARETNSTVFAVNWAGPVQAAVEQPQQNAAVIALNRFAQRFGAYPGSDLPVNQYEAEEGTLHRVGMEASGSGYTGWGYLAGWNGNGQGVDFKVNFAAAGARTLTFRYAAGAGNASRLIRINGVNAFPNQAFASTGSWNSYATVNVSFSFPAGVNTISLLQNTSLGNANYLNLDHLLVTEVRFTDIRLTPEGNVQLTWNTVNGQTYRLQSADAPQGSAWNNLGGILTATGTTTTTTATLDPGAPRYFRIVKP